MGASGAALIWIIPAAAALLTLAAILAGLLLPPPADPLAGQYFSAAFREEAAAYQQARLTVSLLRQLISFGFTGAAVWAAMRYWETAPPPSLAVAAGLILLFLLAAQLLDFPLAYYRGFVIEHRFGLSTATVYTWLLDYGKSTAINLILTTGALAGLYWLVLRWPERWWIAAGTAAALLMLIGSYLYPLLIDPSFIALPPSKTRRCTARSWAWPPQPGSISIGCWWPMPAGAPARSMPTLRGWGGPSGSCFTIRCCSALAGKSCWRWSPTRWGTGAAGILPRG